MAQIKVRYFVERPGAAGSVRYFWQPAGALVKAGWPRQVRLKDPDTGRDLALRTERHVAAAEAEKWNARLDFWRLSENRAAGEISRATLEEYAAKLDIPHQAMTDADLVRAINNRAPGGRRAATSIPAGSVNALIVDYKASDRYRLRSPKTRKDYDAHLRTIAAWCGDLHVAALDEGTIQDWYLAQRKQKNPHTGEQMHARANAILRVLSVLLEFGRKSSKYPIRINPATRQGLIQTPPRVRVLTRDELRALVAAADRLGRPSIGDACVAGAYLGQRRSDLLTLPPLEHRDKAFVIRQNKTGAIVEIPAHPLLVERCETAMERFQRLHNVLGGDNAAPIHFLIHEKTGRRYTPDNFTATFADVRAEAVRGAPDHPDFPFDPSPSLADAWFSDLRDTCVTWLADAGCTLPQICAITGHSERSAQDILKHYLAHTSEQAREAIRRLVAHELELAERAQNRKV